MPRHVTLLSGDKFEITLDRLCYELIENHGSFESSALIGLQPRGIYLGRAIFKRLNMIGISGSVRYGEIDPTFYRDDFRRHKTPLIPASVTLDFSVESLKVVLIDDVLYTGRTTRAGLDALLDFGRPEKVELLVLVDRRYSRQLPIEAGYVGLSVDTRLSQRVKVNWKETEKENSIWLLSGENK